MKIANAYLDKAFNWATLKVEDGKALFEYALYLRECLNAMQNLDHLEELNVASNLKLLISKLPYKLRERWRTKVYEKSQQNNTRIKFKHLVEFLEYQSNILLHPVFGDIRDTPASKPVSRAKPSTITPKGGSSFVTSVTPSSTQIASQPAKTQQTNKRAPTSLSGSCSSDRHITDCENFKSLAHDEKVDHLKTNGYCFGCLKKGHLSRNCLNRAICELCKRKHHTLLHINNEESVKRQVPVNSALISASHATGASHCALAIVPVIVKATKSSKTIKTYAFLDPGSSATFCSDKLKHQLNISGRRTEVALRTMGQDQTVRCYELTGLEVGNIDGSVFLQLPTVYTQAKIPVSKDHLVTPNDLERWPYLSGVTLDSIDAEIELLIGMDVPKAMEPWEVLNSQNDGPYAVRTLLGWVVNGPLNSCSAVERGEKWTATVNRISLETNATSSLIQYFSSWKKLLRAVAWLLKLKRILLHRRRDKVTSTSQGEQQCLTVDDLDEAERAIIRYEQQQHFQAEWELLKMSKPVKADSPVFRLDPIIEDDIMKVGGRIGKAPIPVSTMNPIILPKSSHISKLILRDIHQQIGHAGRNHMLSRLRQKFWLPSANSCARHIVSSCVFCRRMQARPGTQKMADLPQDRVTPNLPPFSHVGIDFFGPMEVKRGRSRVKRWGVLFTCLVSRAIHLEVAASLDTSSCINAIRRFLCRRGHVLTIRTDCGTNFTSAQKELETAFNQLAQEKIQENLLANHVKWLFNPPHAPHFGGVWERLIRQVKKTLFSIVRQQTLDDEMLQTAFCEVECILNDRPLTTTSSDPNDLAPLTPNHLLQLKSEPLPPPGLFSEKNVYSRQRWKCVQYLADLFWRRWTSEYLPLMQQRQKWTQAERNLRVNDIVVLVDPAAQRNSWPLGRVVKTLPGPKGLVRSVLVQTKNNVLQRPIGKLCLLLEGEEAP